MAYTNAISTYKETRVNTASQGQLIIMLYDEGIKHLDRALELLSQNDQGKKNPANIEKISNAILKAQEIVTELTVSLDFQEGGDIARNLFALYSWFTKELLEANISQDMHRVTSVRNQLNELRSAWAEIAMTVPETTGKTITGVNIAG
ncbi:MAG: flagellar export chaperone FliS [Treponema sp.]|nr:flagellar export chaperone FliS [Treponema sp.]